ncbi:MAG: TonB-dependent receptor, partial [Calditrichales bacterium]
MRKLLYVFLCLIFTFSALIAADIKGIVQDAVTSEPLVGVNVYIEGTTIGATTDQDGFFRLEFDPAASFELTFSYVGYKTFKRTFTPQDDMSALSISLNEDIFESETIVVTGIASRTSKDVAEVAVSRVNAEEYSAINTYQSVSQLVSGKVAGVQMIPATGNVGGGFSFHMRSGGGLNGNEQPMIYVDGIRVDNAEVLGYGGAGGQGVSVLSDLNPDDIANIEVLKGSAGAATYGTNGSNGVILITTKKGEIVPGIGRGLAISYNGSYGYNTQWYKYSTDDYVTANDANKIFRDGPIRKHSLNLSGGSNTIKYFTSFTSHNEEGIMPSNQMDRKSFRANVDVFPMDEVTLRFGGSYSLNEISRPFNDNTILGFLGNTLLFPFSYAFTDSVGLYAISDVMVSNRFMGFAEMVYTPIKDMEASFRIGMDQADLREDTNLPRDKGIPLYPGGQRYILNRNNSQYTFDLNLRYKYDVTTGLRATSLLGTQIFDLKRRTSTLTGEEFSTGLITDIGAAESVTDYGEELLHQKDAGIFFEQTFSYTDQYFMTLGLRRDYASLIGKKAADIYYPKASFAMRMDKYDFFPRSWVNLLKLRMAYGESGQLPAGGDAEPLLWQAANGGYGTGAVLSNIGNDELKPERVKEIELGFEAEFLTNYALEFTYYKTNAENSIIGRLEPPSTGLTVTNRPFNVGKIDGWGIETLLQATPVRTADYQLDLSLINNYQDNKVTDLGGAQPIYDGFDLNVVKVGLPKHEFYTWEVTGATFDDAGNYTGPEVSDERVSFGNPIPNYTGSFTLNFRFLKNFNFYVLTDWATNLKVYDLTSIFAGQFGNNPKYNDL